MHNNLIHDLIDRWLNGTCTEQEKKQLQQYFLQYGLPEQELTDDPRYHPDKKQSERIFARLQEEFAPAARTGKVYRLDRKWLLRIAAVVIPLIMLTAVVYLLVLRPGKNNAAIAASVKQIRNNGKGLQSIQLTDGSVVWLNKGASLSLDTATFARQRDLVLEGEAYFEVAHDSIHPFTVGTGELSTRVLGTTFNIKKDTASGRTTVTLFTGKVSIAATGGGGVARFLTPGQEAVYDMRSGQLQTLPASAYALAWKTKEITCEGERFENIIPYLEQYYGVRIKTDQRIAGKRFSGTLSLQGDITSVLERLLFVHQLQYKRNGDNRIVIY